MIHQISHAGLRHRTNGESNQDSVCTAAKGRYIAVTLADGVSSCTDAKAGADIASRALNDLLFRKAEFFFQFDEKQIADIVVSHILFELSKQASADSRDVNEYSSTVSSILIDTKQKKALLIQLGDGMIIGTEYGKSVILVPPDDSSLGCCVTTTKNAAQAVRVKNVDTRTMDSIAVYSDGAWKQMFSDCRLKPEVASLLIRKEYDQLEEFLKQQNGADDYSFVSVDLRVKNERRSA